MRLPTVIIRDVLRVNSDEDIVRSLRTQNDTYPRVSIGPIVATGDGRAMTLSATRCSRSAQSYIIASIKAGLYTWAPKAPGMDQSRWCVCCLGYGHGQAFCKEVSESARTAAGSTLA
ncbi:hypothetical protein EVAR_59906_1 [Eumeta japonica]|uniref:Uncharacterized protein n=1 Tax=Eumeta variegata TaxID=151549 RepID=A0A4C2AEL2_EUMVA|nr:hypothetical protein EVAR_59906_1 [Eumeta japonica]